MILQMKVVAPMSEDHAIFDSSDEGGGPWRPWLARIEVAQDGQFLVSALTLAFVTVAGNARRARSR